MTAFRNLAHRLNLSGWVLVVMLVLAWQFAIVWKIVEFDYLPKPTEVLHALGEVISDGTLFSQMGHTLTTAAIASVIAVALGVGLGALMGLVRPVANFTGASVDFLRSIPAVSLMPVVLLLLGPAVKSEVVVGVFAGVWPILLNTIGGVQAINPRLHEVGRVLHLGRLQRTFKIVIPSIVPSILVGVRLTVVTCLVVVIIAEIMMNPEGLGWALTTAQKSLRPDLLFAYAIVTGVLGYLINLILVLAVRACMPGSPALKGRV
ncbi:ABC transporter permease subunit [Dactylosporangium sp. NPDC051484]|uniref:ABC transporter permease n=1 Tax=Dactylosporangium sp. NPDC051484 TaxID=3154942 RepID=UPI00344C1438